MSYNEYIPMYMDLPSENSKIPSGYKSYTLFFSTSYSYEDSLTVKEIKAMKKRVKEFGRSVGRDNLFVWVGDSSKDKLNIEWGKILADKLSKNYKLNMSYSDGPYIVYVKGSPYLPMNEDRFAACISFAEKKPKYVAEFLDFIEAGIRRNKASILYVWQRNFWISILSFYEKNSEEIKAWIGIGLQVSGKK